MRILYVVDGRSPTALNWISYFVEQGHEVHLVSTYPCDPVLATASLNVLPVWFGRAAGNYARAQAKASSLSLSQSSGRRDWLRKAAPVGLRTAIRQWLGPLSLPGASRRLREIINQSKPDLVHAMRIPFEGILASLAEPAVPLVISVWGNDFTLHAQATPVLARYTRMALGRADALHADCQRDRRLAEQWGFRTGLPAVVLPGGGGIRLEVFYPPSSEAGRERTVINPRGFRSYVHNDAFFHSIPEILAQQPGVRFICPTMAGEAQALRWIDALEIGAAVRLLPRQTQPQMADLFRDSAVVVSPSTHDGTPNTLLEAMACGCFPVAGDIESLREWITPGVNGLLVDPANPHALAEAIITALRVPDLRAQAGEVNLQMIIERAERRRVMEDAERFYHSLPGDQKS